VSIDRGRVAQVTGSARSAGNGFDLRNREGGGQDFRRSQSKAGARVVVTGRDEERGKRVVEEIVGTGAEAVFVAYDFEDADLTRLGEGTEDAFGGMWTSWSTMAAH
jgi:NAD(P)-dependent dehydrogenase (short-subunit alcohol dehydrogenase family)